MVCNISRTSHGVLLCIIKSRQGIVSMGSGIEDSSQYRIVGLEWWFRNWLLGEEMKMSYVMMSNYLDECRLGVLCCF